MTVNSHMAEPNSRQAVTASISLSKTAHGFLSVMARIGSKAMVKATSALRALQMGRMLSTLSNMSDHQLSQIGIQRSDIPRYAETLMADE
ncbi:MAG: DUF1127 domain-containing protein [Paracoccaceae bacterium]